MATSKLIFILGAVLFTRPLWWANRWMPGSYW